MCIMWALVAPNQSKEAGEAMDTNVDEIANNYANWVNSKPYDIGNTTFSALKPLTLAEPKVAYVAKNAALEENFNSMSNSCLFRVTPLAVWAAGLSSNKLCDIVIADCSMTHSLNVCKYAVYIYCDTIRFLLNSKKETI